MNMLMGGGGSFSAGGPGKGMYTRLYTNVLNRHHWMYSATAFNHAYGDAGLFCINASAPPQNIGQLIDIISTELSRWDFVRGPLFTLDSFSFNRAECTKCVLEVLWSFAKTTNVRFFLCRLTGEIGKEEFERAKKQLTSMLLMNLEARPVIFEDLVRQVLAQGQRKCPEHYIDLIQSVTVNDLNRAADRMLSSKLSLAAIGNLRNLPDYKEIGLGLLSKTPRSKRSKLNLFKGWTWSAISFFFPCHSVRDDCCTTFSVFRPHYYVTGIRLRCVWKRFPAALHCGLKTAM